MSDGINARRNGVPEPEFHEVEDIAGAANEEYFHDEVVEGNPAPKQVEVAGNEHRDI